jgi:hypothetical protein
MISLVALRGGVSVGSFDGAEGCLEVSTTRGCDEDSSWWGGNSGDRYILDDGGRGCMVDVSRT